MISFLKVSHNLELGEIVIAILSLALTLSASSEGLSSKSSPEILKWSMISGQLFAVITSLRRGRGLLGMSWRLLKIWYVVLASYGSQRHLFSGVISIGRGQWS